MNVCVYLRAGIRACVRTCMRMHRPNYANHLNIVIRHFPLHVCMNTLCRAFVSRAMTYLDVQVTDANQR